MGITRNNYLNDLVKINYDKKIKNVFLMTIYKHDKTIGFLKNKRNFGIISNNKNYFFFQILEYVK